MRDYRPFQDDTAEIRALDHAYYAEVIGRDALLAGVTVQRGPAQWLAWARFWLLAYSVALALVGVVFFFAYNWAAMHRFEKFALVQVAMVACILLAWRAGWRSPVGQALLLAGAVFIGVFLAVFGQVYQTGADPWQLFFGWAALMFLWVLAANSAALWVLWLAVADVAIILYTVQARAFDSWPWLMAMAGMLPATVLATREVLQLRGASWLQDAWLRPLLLLAALVFFTIPAVASLVDGGMSGGERVLWLATWLVVIGAAFHLYRWRLSDIAALTLIVFNMAVLLLFWIGDVLFGGRMGDGGVLFLFALIILAVMAAAYSWLRAMASDMHNDANGIEAEVDNAHA